MTMPAIHQLVAGFTSGDAISNEAIVLQRIFKSWGFDSDIFSQTNHTLPELRSKSRDIFTARKVMGPADIAVLHLSIGAPVNEIFAALECRKAIIYHNMTPPAYFDLVNRRVAMELEKGREHVAMLAGRAAVNTAVSRFNAGELETAGYRNVRVLPLVLDLDMLVAHPDPKIIARYRDGRKNILFVGRGVPNKKIEDLMTAFFYFKKYVEPASRLIHVGSYTGMEKYHFLLTARMRDLGLANDDVVLTGMVPQAQLNAYYDIADLFLCMSEHEGFCIPLLESMLHNVPVLAYSAAAVPETLDGAGVLFSRKDYADVAEMMDRLIRDQQLRAGVVEQQKKRIQRYKALDLAAELKQCLAPLLP
ncbi:MAG: hypothetical protein C0404_12465 [Verrucomicrobia bacterium]|nr:hypothetical protein [Verrucomicrobiota bacterium]